MKTIIPRPPSLRNFVLRRFSPFALIRGFSLVILIPVALAFVYDVYTFSQLAWFDNKEFVDWYYGSDGKYPHCIGVSTSFLSFLCSLLAISAGYVWFLLMVPFLFRFHCATEKWTWFLNRVFVLGFYFFVGFMIASSVELMHRGGDLGSEISPDTRWEEVGYTATSRGPGRSLEFFQGVGEHLARKGFRINDGEAQIGFAVYLVVFFLARAVVKGRAAAVFPTEMSNGHWIVFNSFQTSSHRGFLKYVYGAIAPRVSMEDHLFNYTLAGGKKLLLLDVDSYTDACHFYWQDWVASYLAQEEERLEIAPHKPTARDIALGWNPNKLITKAESDLNEEIEACFKRVLNTLETALEKTRGLN